MKKYLSLLILICFAARLQADCCGNQGCSCQSYYQQGQYPNEEQNFAKQIQDALYSDHSQRFNNVTVFVVNGYVSLLGVVSTQEDKGALEQKVRNMDGVRAINDQVTVQRNQSRSR